MTNARTCPGCPAPRHGFTLLEAVVALALMAMVLVAALELRVQSLRTGNEVGRAAQAAKHMEALLEMALQGALPDPQRDEAGGAWVWKGEHADRPFTIVRTPERLTNPMADWRRAQTSEPADPVPQDVRVYRYVIEHGSERTTLVWHR